MKIIWEAQQNYGDGTFVEYIAELNLANKKAFKFFVGQQGISLTFNDAKRLHEAMTFLLCDPPSEKGEK